MVLIRKRRGGRRHKKLKAIDPFYSGPRKLLIDKKSFNANQAPKKEKNSDRQVSHRFQLFLDQKEQAKEMSKNKKKKNSTKNEDNDDDKQFPHLKQKPNESDRNYIQRLNQEAKFALDCAKYESKYDVKLVPSNKEDHQVQVKKEKSQRTEKRLKRLQEKKEEMKLKKTLNEDLKIDKPKFGEIVHQPPTLNLPKRSKIDPSKAGTKDLLLNKKYFHR